MKSRCQPPMQGQVGGWRGVSMLAVVMGLAGACDRPLVSLWRTAPAETASMAAPALTNDPPRSDPQPVELVRGPDAARGPAVRRAQLDVVFTVLHVQIPRDGRAQAEPLWNHLREDVLDHATGARLQNNGLRVGIGQGEWWDAVKATLDTTAGVRSTALDPIRVPPDYPLALELDDRPHEQTLFYVADDGILTGESWPHSRNVLRISYDLNLANPERVRVMVVPEVRQRLDGWRWVRSESGLTQMPNFSGRAFGAAAFVTDLEPGEFLLVAPSRQADLFGIVGGAFLSSEQDGRRYDSYVFLRADVNYVAHRN